MPEQRVWSFFYGSFMNRKVMGNVGHTLSEFEVATLPGFDLRIAPHANLVRKPGLQAFGILTQLTRATLAALYETQSRGVAYLPEAVIVVDLRGRQQAALCYLANDMPEGKASSAYVETIAAPAVEYGFPTWYVDKIRSFAAA